jgi:hypothetical protein
MKMSLLTMLGFEGWVGSRYSLTKSLSSCAFRIIHAKSFSIGTVFGRQRFLEGGLFSLVGGSREDPYYGQSQEAA